MTGASIFYMTDTGLYLFLGFYAYLILYLFSAKEKKRVFDGAVFFLPILTTLTLMALLLKENIFTKVFWQNILEFAGLMLNGWGAVPLLPALKTQGVLSSAMAIGMPLVYLLTILFEGSSMVLKKSKSERILSAAVGVYGLGLFHYFIVRSTPGGFFVVCLPFIFLICFWLDKILTENQIQKVRILLPLVAVMFISLVLSPTFLDYPNFLNQKKNIHEQKDMAHPFLPPQDIELIRGLTEKNEKVCIFSNLETAFLIAADRKPFFYYSPLIFSRSFDMRDFGGTSLFTAQRLQKTMRDLETEKPRNFFIEEKFLNKLPTVYYSYFTDLAEIINYLRKNYEFSSRGRYLAAFKRKD